MPEGRTLRELGYISVWCRKFSANFGHIALRPLLERLTIPTAIEIRPLSQLDHGVKSGVITIIDAQTFLISDFNYDGQGPAGYWWASKGDKQNAQGKKLFPINSTSSEFKLIHQTHLFLGTHLPDENGTYKPLRRYGGETVVISLPEGKTIYDYDVLGVWCEKYFVDFGHTRIPHSILVPPSPRMLGVKPEVLYRTAPTATNSADSTIAFTPAPASPATASFSSYSASFSNAVQPGSEALLHSTVVNGARQAASAGARRRPPQRRPPLATNPKLVPISYDDGRAEELSASAFQPNSLRSQSTIGGRRAVGSVRRNQASVAGVATPATRSVPTKRYSSSVTAEEAYEEPAVLTSPGAGAFGARLSAGRV